MTPSEYLDAAKQRLNIESDYELAKRLEIPRQYVSAYRKGASIDNLTAFKLAITLEMDPATVLADLESQREKDEKKRGFWTGFMRRAAIVAALACTLAWSYSATYEDAARLVGGVAAAASAAFWQRRKYA